MPVYGCSNLVGPSHTELDLRRQSAVADFFTRKRPEYVFLAAARVGGIWANNTYPAQFIYDNLMIQTNVIHQAHLHGVKKSSFWAVPASIPRPALSP